MSVYLHRWNDCEYFRVYRAWNKQEYQEYIPIDPKNPALAEKKAREIDEGFKSRQRAYYARQVYCEEYHLELTGKIRGINLENVLSRHNKPTQRFRVRANVPWEDSTYFTTVTISKKRSIEEAFKLAIQRYCDFFAFDERSHLRKALSQHLSYYTSECTAVVEKVPSRASERDFMRGLQDHIEEFKREKAKQAAANKHTKAVRKRQRA